MLKMGRAVLGLFVAMTLVSFAHLAWAESHAWLGLVMYDASRASPGEVADGIFIMMVYENSPAFSSGARVGDIIIGLDGRTLTKSQELICAIAARIPGDVVQLTAIRGGEKIVFSVALADRPPGVYASPPDCAKILSSLARSTNIADSYHTGHRLMLANARW
jgi:S1-C subfamily serine protease